MRPAHGEPAGRATAAHGAESIEALLGSLVLLLAQKTPEELKGILGYVASHPLPGSDPGRVSGGPKVIPAGDSVRPTGKAGPVYSFRWTGRDWEVAMGGSKPFYLEDTLAAKYLDYLLHHPNVPISAFDLEVAITPEKGEARSRNSIQLESDPQALREYRQELTRLRAEMEAARVAGEAEEVARLEGEIKALVSALQGGRAGTDTGQRAYDSVRKRVAGLRERLTKGSREQRAFSQHLETHLNIGFECLYSQPDGRIWS